MTKLLCIFGTRPEAIKMAPVITALSGLPDTRVEVCITAQHRQMLDQVLALFQIKVDYDLDLMQPNQTLAGLSSRILAKLDPILECAKPDRVFVHGDTTTTFIATLCAFYHQIPIAHIEAGLRSRQLYSPWPEEANRHLTGVLTDCHFAPTAAAAANLRAEGHADKHIYITGNTVIDALLMTKHMIDSSPQIQQQLAQQFYFLDPNKRLILITGHRRESFGQGFQHICQALATLASRDDIQMVYPMHLNPNVQQPVNALLAKYDHIHLIDPLDYLPFVYLMSQSHVILTDSGGIQEEAPALGKPVLVMREVTERPEAVNAGTAKLVGTDIDQITTSVIELLDNDTLYQQMSHAHNPYGDGTASQQIARIIRQYHSATQAATS